MKLLYLLAISLTFIGCQQMSDIPNEEIPEENVVETPLGPVTTHTTDIEAIPQTITIVSGESLLWLKSLNAQGSEFLKFYAPDSQEIGLAAFDKAFRAWQKEQSPLYTDQQVIEIVGGYLGNRCVEDFDMEWVIVTDEHGTDYAIQSKQFEVLSFPFSTVLKRIESKEYDFINGVYYAIKELLEDGKSQRRAGTP